VTALLTSFDLPDAPLLELANPVPSPTLEGAVVLDCRTLVYFDPQIAASSSRDSGSPGSCHSYIDRNHRPAPPIAFAIMMFPS
jgi:hypothetical protein